MEAVRQYLDLYHERHADIDAGSAGVMNSLRRKAAESLAQHPLPERGAENYQTTDLQRMLAPDFGINILRLRPDDRSGDFRCGVPVVAGKIFVQINDTLLSSGTPAQLPEGVEAGSLRDFATRYPELMEQFYGRAADIGNPVVALNTLLAQDGFFLRIRRGTKLEAPVQLLNFIDTEGQVMAVRRVLVIAEEDSQATLLVCNHTRGTKGSSLDLPVIELFAGRGARLDYYEMEESDEMTSRLSALYLRQAEGSEVTIDSMTLRNGTTRNEFYCMFEGERASLRLLGMGIEDGRETLSTYSHIDHAVPRCKSDELFKYSAADNSVADFTGRIHVAPGAVGTEAYQSNRNLLSSAEAKIYSKPQLEIYNDDVKCSHGSAVGQLDPLQLFYMRTRGLTLEEATLLLRRAFVADVIEAVKIPALRERLHLLVEKRFSGADAACADCPVSH